MSPRRLEMMLWVLTGVLSATALHGWFRALPARPPVAREEAAPMIAAMPDTRDLERAASAVNDADPFRLSRVRASVPFGTATQQEAAPDPVARPTLVLRGIVGGPPWQAIVDGIPGIPDGSVLKAGQTFEKYVIRSVSKDTVIVQGPDTTWHLTLGNKGAQ